MSKANFTYNISASKDEILTALITHLTPRESKECWGMVDLENAIEILRNAQQDKLNNPGVKSFQLGQLIFRMDYMHTSEMADLLHLYSQSVQDYLPPKMQGPGSTAQYFLGLYPLNLDSSNHKFFLESRPDYRGQEISRHTPDEIYAIGIQSLRFGYDFFCRALNPLMGEPEIKIESHTIPKEILVEILKPEYDLIQRLEIFKEILPK